MLGLNFYFSIIDAHELARLDRSTIVLGVGDGLAIVSREESRDWHFLAVATIGRVLGTLRIVIGMLQQSPSSGLTRNRKNKVRAQDIVNLPRTFHSWVIWMGLANFLDCGGLFRFLFLIRSYVIASRILWVEDTDESQSRA